MDIRAEDEVMKKCRVITRIDENPETQLHITAEEGMKMQFYFSTLDLIFMELNNRFPSELIAFAYLLPLHMGKLFFLLKNGLRLKFKYSIVMRVLKSATKEYTNSNVTDWQLKGSIVVIQQSGHSPPRYKQSKLLLSTCLCSYGHGAAAFLNSHHKPIKTSRSAQLRASLPVYHSSSAAEPASWSSLSQNVISFLRNSKRSFYKFSVYY
ncbi:UNVERIFIED_CONTAM: hypothetical protein FKN15_020274 [Acipenser sinensis]